MNPRRKLWIEFWFWVALGLLLFVMLSLSEEPGLTDLLVDGGSLGQWLAALLPVLAGGYAFLRIGSTWRKL